MPGFPQMAWPMLEWVLDQRYRHLFDRDRWAEASVIVYLPESTIAPLMEEINATYKGLKAFSLPSMGAAPRLAPPHRTGRARRTSGS